VLSLPENPYVSFEEFIEQQGGSEAYVSEAYRQRFLDEQSQKYRSMGFWGWSLLYWQLHCTLYLGEPTWAYLEDEARKPKRKDQEPSEDRKANLRRNFRRDGLKAMAQVRALAEIRD